VKNKPRFDLVAFWYHHAPSPHRKMQRTKLIFNGNQFSLNQMEVNKQSSSDLLFLRLILRKEFVLPPPKLGLYNSPRPTSVRFFEASKAHFSRPGLFGVESCVFGWQRSRPRKVLFLFYTFEEVEKRCLKMLNP
jgi:hypothetical protein